MRALSCSGRRGAHSLMGSWAQRLSMRAGVCATLGMLAAPAACAISERDEVELGASEAASIDSQVPTVADPQIAGYITQTGQLLASQTSRADLGWRFTVVDAWPLNAFALPGGFVYVTRGLIENSDRLEELAGVMAHEVAHVARRHTVKQIQQSEKQDAGLTVLCVLTRVCGTIGGAIAVQVGIEAETAQYSQLHEAEADSVGVLIAMRAGINPEGLITFLEKLLAQRAEQPTPLEVFFASHPTDEYRIAALRRHIAALPAASTANLHRDTPEFQAFRERVRALPMPPAPFDTLGAPTRRK